MTRALFIAWFTSSNVKGRYERFGPQGVIQCLPRVFASAKTQCISIVVLLLIFICSSGALGQNETRFKHLEDAAALIQRNMLGQAEQQLNEVLKTAPNEAQALNLLGAIRAKQGKLIVAETLFKRAAGFDNQLVSVHWNLALLYELTGAPDKTITQLKEVIRIEPINGAAFLKLARLLLSQHHLDECITLIESAKHPPAIRAALRVVLGNAYLEKHDLDKGEKSYLLSLDSDNENAEALLGLTQISESRGDTQRALLYLSRAKPHVANSPDLLYRFALLAFSIGRDNDAMELLRNAVKEMPDEPSYLLVLGMALLRTRNPDLVEAEQVFRRVLKIQPDNTRGQLHLGYVLLEQKKYPEAREWLEKSARIDTGIPEPLYYLGLVAQEQSDDATAIGFFQKAIRLDHSYAFAHGALGSSYLKLRDYPRAREELELAVKLDPNEPKAHYNLAMLYARLKDYPRSQGEMAIVEKLKSGSSSNRAIP